MPRFFFHVIDGVSLPDADGVELPDIWVAQDQAVRLAGEILRETGARIWDSAAWRVAVADERGRTLLTLRFLADEPLPPPPGH